MNLFNLFDNITERPVTHATWLRAMLKRKMFSSRRKPSTNNQLTNLQNVLEGEENHKMKTGHNHNVQEK